MSNSDLVTTALATGGTSFDTATCISGKCEYPLQQYGNYAKLYTHQMIQTQNKYDPPPLNTTLEVLDASTAPNGSKPNRSPFDDDAGAYFVGDTNLNNLGNGLVSFNRLYSNIPSDHIEPYGLYSRILPALDTEEVVLDVSKISNAKLRSEFQYTDGNYYQARESSSQSDFPNLASTYVDMGYSGVPTLGTNSNEQGNWVNYTGIRAKYTFTYTDTNQDLQVGANIKIFGSYSYTKNNNTYSGDAYARAYFDANRRVRVYSSSGNYWVDQTHREYISDTWTITDITVGANGVQEVTAVTITKDLTNYASQATSNNTSTSHYNRVYYHIETGKEYYWYHNNVASAGNYRTDIANLNYSSRNYELAGRASAGEVNSSSHLAYRYIKTDDPTTIQLTAKTVFPATLSSTTTPTQQQYRNMVKDNTYINAENEYIERYLGNIYRLAQIKTLLE